MANYRLVNTAIWDDDWFSNLDYTERYLFLYLLTSPLTNISGIYQVPLKRVAFDTGMEQPMLKNILKRFADDGKVFYEIGWVVMKNWYKHQHLNPNQQQAAISAVNGLPQWLRERLLNPMDSLYINLEDYLNTSIELGKPLVTLRPKRREENTKYSTSLKKKADSPTLEGSAPAKKPMSKDELDIEAARAKSGKWEDELDG